MKVLHLEDSALDHILVRKTLQSAGFQWTLDQAESAEQFRNLIEHDDYDLILADYQLPGFTAIDAWNDFPDSRVRPPFILFSGAIGEAAAVAAIQLGFADYLSKTESHRLPHVLQRALEFARNLREKQAADAALALSQQRLSDLNEHLQRVIEHERKSISREIHDDIGSALAAAKMDLAWIQRRDLSEDLRTHADSAQKSIQMAIDASRRLMLNLRPSVLDDGLRPAVQWLADDFSRRNNVPVALRLRDDLLTLSADTMLVAFRTTQEALTNIAKHANCSSVAIDISSHEDVLTVEITDNGAGMNGNERLKRNSFGLRGLEERAQSVGGWLDVSSRSGHGTSITLTIPLNEKTTQPEEAPE